ncbi:hypothetical protein BDV59DRAFT_186292 [Aspergillus ambiguus]|uniref:uncharacterized protein n=1 Tax=Aspergillus ambiguus TaxID=176160 RepID=UPI003CCDAB29
MNNFASLLQHLILSKMHFQLLPSILLPTLSHAFSLSTISAHWNYTTNSLATTTSSRCQEAYSAKIDCNEYLVQLVNAGEERHFLDSMEPQNFTRTCTSTCQSSLSDYIENVRSSCTEPGDAAVKSLGFLGQKGTENVPVQTVGLLFQYTLMRSCSKDEVGNFCYIQESSYLPTDFDCDWVCALAYYWNRHEYPYSSWRVGDPSVLEINSETHHRVKVGNDMLFMDSVEDMSIDEGWKNIQKCGYGNSTSAPFDIGIKKDANKTEDSTSTTAGSMKATSMPLPTDIDSLGNRKTMAMQLSALVGFTVFVLL